MTGGAGGDELCGSVGRDEIRGSAGNDSIGMCGGDQTGIDRYLGGPGDDVISSIDSPEGASVDVVNGGDGTDTCSIDPEDVARNCESVVVA